MSNPSVQNQTVQNPQVKETREVRPEPQKAPSHLAKHVSGADASSRASYQLEYNEHDYKTVESAQGNMTIIASTRTAADNDAKLDRDEAIGLATAAQFRRSIAGGLNRDIAAPSAPEAADNEPGEFENDLQLLALRSRGRV